MGPEPRFENTMLDGRTAAQKKKDGEPIPTPKPVSGPDRLDMGIRST